MTIKKQPLNTTLLKIFHKNKYVEFSNVVFKENNLMRWVQQYNETGEVTRKNRFPIAYKIRKIHVNFILSEINKNKTIAVLELSNLLKKKFPNTNIHRSHLHRIIRDSNVTLKLTRFRHEPVKLFGKDVNISKSLKEFYTKIKKFNINNIICIDETSIRSLEKRIDVIAKKVKGV